MALHKGLLVQANKFIEELFSSSMLDEYEINNFVLDPVKMTDEEIINLLKNLFSNNKFLMLDDFELFLDSAFDDIEYEDMVELVNGMTFEELYYKTKKTVLVELENAIENGGIEEFDTVEMWYLVTEDIYNICRELEYPTFQSFGFHVVGFRNFANDYNRLIAEL